MQLSSEETKIQIIELYKEGKPKQIISDLVGIPRTTISDFLNRNTYTSWWDGYDSVNIDTNKVSIYSIDIETSPIITTTWGIWNQNIGLNQILIDWQMLCFTAKNLNHNEYLSFNAKGDYPIQIFVENSYEAQIQMVAELWDILEDADIVIAHNAKKFDVKKINTKFVEFGFKPPSTYKVVDTLNIVKANFAATSNKLQYWTKFLGQEGKLQNDGMPLWINCLKGEEGAWGDMVDYCEQDVGQLEEFYLKIRGWDKHHPSTSVHFDDGVKRCSVCQSVDLVELDKPVTTNQSKFTQYRCNGCGHILRDKINKRTKQSMKQTMLSAK